ncbi:MAG: 8-amino-7-oxononanoate synthase [Bacteroidales bacterium]|jgi:8-amino-7-oxononanoate synthase|nr:8-amino-7-oxononanoate synthase [Bacteroidales bacterium]
MSHDQSYKQSLEKLQKSGGFRSIHNPVPDNMINVCSNDYLGLQHDSKLYEEFSEELSSAKYRFTAASSRLLTGNSDEYNALETYLKKLYSTESALVFNSGYHINAGILPALTDKHDLIIADKYVHASIIDGLKLSSTDYIRYRHLDYEHLEKILKDKAHKYSSVFIVTESIFSMDGDCADLPKIVALKKKYNAFLYVDEAHALGVRGEKGLGLAEEQNCIADCDFIVGTFGKAIASIGAFVVCNKIFASYVINHTRTLIYTTALPPINLAWTLFIMKKIPQYSDKRAHLQNLQELFVQRANLNADTHIIPYILGTNEEAIRYANNLQNKGIYALPVRYPTVPRNKARIRFSLHAGLSEADIITITNILHSHEI